jgi:hypothetical protein
VISQFREYPASTRSKIGSMQHVPKSRRKFLAQTSLGLLGAVIAPAAIEAQSPSTLPPGAPPAFGTASAVGPEISTTTFAEAEKLIQVQLTSAARAEAAGNWRNAMAPLYERRTGPRKVVIEPTIAPWSRWDAALPDKPAGPARNYFKRAIIDMPSLPKSDTDIAFAPVTHLSHWIETHQLTSQRLTLLYLERIERFNPTLRCVITVTRDRALAQAKQADTEIAAGHYRGPLHGIPWGAKDLLDTAGILTT